MNPIVLLKTKIVRRLIEAGKYETPGRLTSTAHQKDLSQTAACRMAKIRAVIECPYTQRVFEPNR